MACVVLGVGTEDLEGVGVGKIMIGVYNFKMYFQQHIYLLKGEKESGEGYKILKSSYLDEEYILSIFVRKQSNFS